LDPKYMEAKKLWHSSGRRKQAEGNGGLVCQCGRK